MQGKSSPVHLIPEGNGPVKFQGHHVFESGSGIFDAGDIPVEVEAIAKSLRNHLRQGLFTALAGPGQKDHRFFSGELPPDFHVQGARFHAGCISSD